MKMNLPGVQQLYPVTVLNASIQRQFDVINQNPSCVLQTHDVTEDEGVEGFLVFLDPVGCVL